MKSNNPEFCRVTIAGVSASIVLMVLMYLTPLIGLPGIDMASTIGSPIAGHYSQVWSPSWWLGLIIFLFVGSFLSPVLYLHTRAALYGRPWLRGVEWGFLVWTVGGVVAMVYLGLGFREPHVSHPLMTSLASLLGHLVYGAILGAVSSAMPIHAPAELKHA